MEILTLSQSQEPGGPRGQLNPGLLLPSGGGTCLWFGALGAESSWILGCELQEPTQLPKDAGRSQKAEVLTRLPQFRALLTSSKTHFMEEETEGRGEHGAFTQAHFVGRTPCLNRWWRPWGLAQGR